MDDEKTVKKEEPRRENKWSDLINDPLFMPRGSIRDIISLVFSLAFVFITYKMLILFKSEAQTFNMIFTTFVGVVNLVIGYYFGSRTNSK